MANTMRSFYTTYIRGNRVNELIAINVVLFVAINLIQAVASWRVVDVLAAPAAWSLLLHKPWTVITHMFTHENFGHVFFNMLVLFFMGQFFIQMQSGRRLTTLYLLAGLSGYLLFSIAFGFGSNHGLSHSVIGASAATMGLVVTTAVLRPLQPIHLFGVFKMELRWLAGLMVLMDLFSIKEGVNSGGHVGHLGGALFGLYYGYQLRKGSGLFDSLKFKNPFQRKMKVAYKQGRPKTDDQFNAEKADRQKRMDHILDKISRSGYDSLTRDEKDFLFHQAQK